MKLTSIQYLMYDGVHMQIWWQKGTDDRERERETEKEHVGTSREMEMFSSLNDIDVTVVQTDWSEHLRSEQSIIF